MNKPTRGPKYWEGTTITFKANHLNLKKHKIIGSYEWDSFLDQYWFTLDVEGRQVKVSESFIDRFKNIVDFPYVGYIAIHSF